MAKCSTPSRMRRAFVENDKSLQILERNVFCDTIYRYANTIPLCSHDNSCIKPISSTVADRNKQAIRDIRAVMHVFLAGSAFGILIGIPFTSVFHF